VEFKIQISRPGKSWKNKINQMVAAFLTRVRFLPLHTLSLSTASLTCSISTGLNSPGKTWIMDINGPGKSWKTHLKRSWKVMEDHF